MQRPDHDVILSTGHCHGRSLSLCLTLLTSFYKICGLSGIIGGYQSYFFQEFRAVKGNADLTRSLTAVPQLRRLVTGFSPQRPAFSPRVGRVGFVVNKVALGQIFRYHLSFHLYSMLVCRDSYHRELIQ